VKDSSSRRIRISKKEILEPLIVTPMPGERKRGGLAELVHVEHSLQEVVTLA